MRCLACDFDNPPGMSFCGRCGTPLGGARPGAAEPARAELRPLTVLSCGLVGVADLADPDELQRAVADFQAAAGEVVQRFDGHVAHNQGDVLAVYFGYPKAHGDDARRALYAGLDLVAATAGLARLAEAGGRRLAARVGVSTGSAITGPAAGGERRPALGSVPHEAACLMELAEPGAVLLAGNTWRLARDSFAFEALGPKTFEGLSQPLDAYRALRPAAAGLFEPPAAAGRPAPLIGRRQERALLLQRFAEAREGHGQVVLVSGEPGFGKTRLVRAFSDRLAEDGSSVLECLCSPYGTNTPLGPFVHLLSRLAASQAADSGIPTLAGLEALARHAGLPAGELVPYFAELLRLPLAEPYSPLELTPEAKRKQTLEALLALFLGLAEEQALALIAEDLHWADPSSLRLFDLLVAQGRDAPLLTVLTFRPEFEPPWAWQARVTHLPMSRLSCGEVADLIDAAEGAELPAAVREEIARRADGVPLFVEEITKATVVEAAQLGGPAGSAQLRDIPATLQESLSARLDRLGNAKAVAQRAAALGSSFSLELLAAVSLVGEAALAAELDRLVAAGLLLRSGFGWRSRYQFKHALLQDMAYRSLLRADQRQLHETIVRALDERFPELVELEPELSARHATEAGLTSRAIELWHRAGRLAFERSANAEAIAHFRQALELVERQPPGSQRDRCELRLLTDLGPALIAARGYASSDAEAVYLRADDLCRWVDDAAQRLRVLKGLHVAYFSQAEFGKAMKNLYVLRELETRGDLGGVEVHFREGAGAISTFRGDFTAASEHLGLADALSQRDAAPFAMGHDVRTAVLSTHALVLWSLGYPEQALERYYEAMAWARQIGHLFSLLFALHLGIWLRQFRGEAESVAIEARELRARAEELELSYLKAESDVFLGWSSALSVAPEPAAPAVDEAIRRLRRGIAQHEAVGMRFGSAYRFSLLAEACLRWGRLEEAGAALTEARAAADRSGEGFRSAEIHRLRGEWLLAKGGSKTVEDAEEAFRSALETARRQHAKALELRAAVSLGRLWATLGRSGDARELVSEIYGWFTEGAELPDLRAARELLDELSSPSVHVAAARCS